MIELQDLTEKLKTELEAVIKEIESETNAEKVRELCLKANHLLMTYNLESWNKIYRTTLPTQPRQQPQRPAEKELEFEMPPV